MSLIVHYQIVNKVWSFLFFFTKTNNDESSCICVVPHIEFPKSCLEKRLKNHGAHIASAFIYRKNFLHNARAITENIETSANRSIISYISYTSFIQEQRDKPCNYVGIYIKFSIKNFIVTKIILPSLVGIGQYLTMVGLSSISCRPEDCSSL